MNWKNAFIWEFGATRYWTNGWHLSAGYTFVENAVPTENLLPVVPDHDRHFFAIGLGRNSGNFFWQATYQYAYSGQRTVSGNHFAPVDGRYDLDSQAVAVSLGYRW